MLSQTTGVRGKRKLMGLETYFVRSATKAAQIGYEYIDALISAGNEAGRGHYTSRTWETGLGISRIFTVVSL